MTMTTLRTLLLLISATTCAALKLKASSNRILDSADPAAGANPKVGDGAGRPLYAVNDVTMPPVPAAGSPTCIGLAVDPTSNNFKVQTLEVHLEGQQADPAAFIARGCFLSMLQTTGWSHLNISTSTDAAIPLAARAYGAGIVEGLLTNKEVGDFKKTVMSLLEKDLTSVAQTGAKASVEKAVRMALIAWDQLAGSDTNTGPTDPVAKQAWAALLQMRGIRDGYNILAAKNSQPTVSLYEMMLMNMHSELPALVDIYSRSEQSKILSATPPAASFLQKKNSPAVADESKEKSVDWMRWASHMPRGSAIVRRVGPVGTPEDLLSGHVAHGNFGEMSRIMKTYKINFGTPVGKVLMTSYPACISSTDDYIQTDAGFVLMSTNMFVPDTSMFSRPQTTNEGLPSFVRATIATRIATQPRGWAKTYSQLTGVAGGKQWLVVDYSKFKGQAPVPDGTVFMLEAMPTLTRMGDVTSLLNTNGFVEAHGTPHFRQIREIYGLSAKGPGTFKEHLGSALVDKGGEIDNLAVGRTVLTAMAPYRQASATEISQIPISARNDLQALYGVGKALPEGGLDAKLTSRCLMKQMSMQAISGPAFDGANVAFDWSAFSEWPHNGLPSTYNFAWQNINERGATPMDDTAGASPTADECDIAGAPATGM